ncbi:pilus assembly protein PilM [Vibrio methylphosphonaticus]|uniref:pilus assembly protein PilM n=1 Tax=Vibrio methylphosphonaticus TaxID=2946866 RepID=UPI00202A5C12|nr:pilus assembly protein PilM [Vibrio methylphosphonaticus]MCL9775578.1 pilus assembly protein PilM [Vibrio methylphosphonaticus]
MTKKWITGIDIGHYSAKAVVLMVDGATLTVINHLELAGSDAIFSDSHTLKHQETVKNLKNFKKLPPIFRKKAALAIPDSAVISKIISIEKGLVGQEQEFAVLQAMSHQTPYPLEELALDFYKASPISEGHTEAYRVYVVKQSLVDNWSKTINKLGYQPQYMDTNINALRGLQGMLSHQQDVFDGWGILDIGRQQAALCPPKTMPLEMAKQWLYDTTRQHDQLANVVKQKSEAEQAFEQVASKVMSQIQLYRSLPGGQGMEGLLVCGGHANAPQFVDFIERKLGMPVRPLALHNAVAVSSKETTLLSGSFAVALGVAYNASQWMETH